MTGRRNLDSSLPATGRRNPFLFPIVNRRPQLSITAPAASAEEAAAIVAALERFMRDTAPKRHPPPPQRSAWGRAALLEATGHEPGAGPISWGT